MRRPAKVFPALVIVRLDRPRAVHPCEPVMVIPEAIVSEPYRDSAAVVASVPANPANVMSAPIRGISAVNVPVVFTSTTTLSCGNGTREVHLVESDQLPPALDVWV